ncbi:MAG: UDP-2,4-diacetamido-2,4,6-trideoxy-beta-L-altropyranose hydrolase [Ruminococcus sp.]|nr:UDP-2,4-diacetamido-2,4,6-trideoxy-beta-L-altropyranose hydrolase [Ruminococcus sp.]
MILIRADANEQIGTGHVMRCMSLAWEFVKHGQKLIFVTADHSGDELIKQKGFQSVCIDSEWTEMDSEIEALKRVIDKYDTNLLLVDSYYVTKEYFNELSEMVNTAYFDDMNISCWNIDFLINYNIFATIFDYSEYDRTRTQLLLGPQYTPLRKEFRNLPKHETRNHVKDILISAGGADPEHITERIMNGICSEMLDVRFHFVIGALNPRLEYIINISRDKENVVLHINENHMSDLMMKCDLAISAAGTTLYELCAAGIPTITYSLADNQLVAAEQFNRKEIMLSLGDCRNNESFIDQIKFAESTMDYSTRKKLSERMQCFVDGNGSERIVNEIMHI